MGPSTEYCRGLGMLKWMMIAHASCRAGNICPGGAWRRSGLWWVTMVLYCVGQGHLDKAGQSQGPFTMFPEHR